MFNQGVWLNIFTHALVQLPPYLKSCLCHCFYLVHKVMKFEIKFAVFGGNLITISYFLSFSVYMHVHLHTHVHTCTYTYHVQPFRVLHLVKVNMWSPTVTSCHLSKELWLPMTSWHHLERPGGDTKARMPRKCPINFDILWGSPGIVMKWRRITQEFTLQ